METITKKYAKCSFSGCNNKAEWVMGTWQCCDECAGKWVTETEKGHGYSVWGTSTRIGQENILAHNIRFNLECHMV